MSKNHVADGIYIVVRKDGKVLFGKDVPENFPGIRDTHIIDKGWRRWMVGQIDRDPVILAMAPDRAKIPSGMDWYKPRAFFAELTATHTNALSRCCILRNWYDNNRYCGGCGTGAKPATKDTALVCPKCSKRTYPIISPSIIVQITNGDKILLANNFIFSRHTYSCVAGYVEAGETVENAVLREIREEVNLEAAPPVYLKSQSWPFPHSLMMAFTTTASGDPKPDGTEIRDAKWFSADDLPNLPGKGGMGRHLIELWLDGLK